MSRSTIEETLMRRKLGLVAVVGFALLTGSAGAAAPGTITWHSRDGLNGAGSNAASGARIMASADGSKVVFEADANNLGGAAGATSLHKGYLRDVRTGVNRLVTGPENQPGVVANGSTRTHDLVISGDGRWIVFGSHATNLIPGFADNNAAFSDLYLYEVATGDLMLISHSTAGANTGSNGQSDTPSISHDGRYVLYGSSSNNLASGFVDNNGSEYDIYVFDRAAGTNRLVSRTPGSATTGLNATALDAAITPDGRYAVVNTAATNIDPYGNNNGTGADFFLTPIASGQYQLISHAPGAPTQGSDDTSETPFNSVLASTSAGKVTFNSTAHNLVIDFVDLNGTAPDTYVWDRNTDTIKLVSHEFNSPTQTRGGNGGTFNFETGISADGSLIAYTNTSTNLVPGFSGSLRQVYGYDTRTGENELLVHVPSNPLQAGNAESLGGFPTADGRFVAFISLATNLVPGFVDGNGNVPDSFLLDRTGSPAPVSQTPPAVTGAVTLGSTLTCDPGTWSEDPTFTFSWQRGTTQIGTGSTYALTADDTSQPVRCVVIATTFGGSTSAASGAVTLPPTIAGAAGPTGPAGQTGATGPPGQNGAPGPAGAAAPVAFALAATKFTAKANKNLKLPFVSTAAGKLTWTATAKGQKAVKKTLNVKAGRGTFTIKLPKKGSWKLTVTVAAGGKTARDTAVVKVR